VIEILTFASVLVCVVPIVANALVGPDLVAALGFRGTPVRVAGAFIHICNTRKPKQSTK
jgi:hypothetical protein